PHIFEDRLYLYGSHDRFNGDNYCLNNYVCWSAPLNDLSDWQFHGEIFDIKKDPLNADGEYCGYAPDCCRGPDGRYYLYYALNNHLAMSVAVCDTPAGKYEFLGHMKTAEGRIYGTKAGDAYVFDPAVIVDNDGRIHLYMGFSPTDGMGELREHLRRWRTEGCHHIELCDDMVTMKTDPVLVAPGCNIAEGTSFAGHGFFEAPSIRKFFEKYYFVYSSEHFQELCYAVSNAPEGPFKYKGRLVSNGDIGINGRTEPINHTGNNHGGLVEINGKFYIFYHRHTNNTDYSRQACAEEITVNDNGDFSQAEITSCGLNGAPLQASGIYGAGIACNICVSRPDAPYITQSGSDREDGDDQYIKNMKNGSFVGYKYFDFKDKSTVFATFVSDCDATVDITIEPEGDPVGTIQLSDTFGTRKRFVAKGIIPTGVYPLYFHYRGEGSADLISFEFVKAADGEEFLYDKN
ncbi:MAG: family 43 glycosylhydrolase, partial [Clostridia bacterium]|nr:family 43 glycosylhydrolase [Clostridia bacterium]